MAGEQCCFRAERSLYGRGFGNRRLTIRQPLQARARGRGWSQQAQEEVAPSGGHRSWGLAAGSLRNSLMELESELEQVCSTPLPRSELLPKHTPCFATLGTRLVGEFRMLAVALTGFGATSRKRTQPGLRHLLSAARCSRQSASGSLLHPQAAPREHQAEAARLRPRGLPPCRRHQARRPPQKTQTPGLPQPGGRCSGTQRHLQK